MTPTLLRDNETVLIFMVFKTDGNRGPEKTVNPFGNQLKKLQHFLILTRRPSYGDGFQSVSRIDNEAKHRL